MSNFQISGFSSNFWVLTAPTTLWSISNITVPQIWTWSLKLTWDIMPTADKYYVYLWWHFMSASVNNNENILTVESLSPNTLYNIKVVGVKWIWTFWNWVAWFWTKVLKNVTTLAE